MRPLIATFAEASRIAASESRVSAVRLGEIPDEWRDRVGSARGGSAVAKLLTLLPARPILSSEDACTVVDAPRSSVFAAINRLRDAGVLRPLPDRKRDQVWGAGRILDDLDNLGVRIAHASRRQDALCLLANLPQARSASHAEVMTLIQTRHLFGVGIGYLDAHLLAATLLAEGARLWTRDKRLGAVAADLGLAARVPTSRK